MSDFDSDSEGFELDTDSDWMDCGLTWDTGDGGEDATDPRSVFEDDDATDDGWWEEPYEDFSGMPEYDETEDGSDPDQERRDRDPWVQELKAALRRMKGIPEPDEDDEGELEDDSYDPPYEWEI